jgi:hypothetical protein
MLSVNGRLLPCDLEPDRFDNCALTETKIDLTKIASYYHYNDENTDFIVDPPWVTLKNYYWWMNKYLPGMILPMHNDANEHSDVRRYVRYWMPLQDYERGHIFLYEDTLITGYKKGDLYEYSDEQAYHAGGNAGWNPRLVLNVTAWEDL